MSEAALLTMMIVLPFAGSLFSVMLPARSRNLPGGIAGATALLCHALAWFLYPVVADGRAARMSLEWVPGLGLEFSLRMDGLAWLFALLITGIGFLVVVYARYYMAAEDPVPALPFLFPGVHGSDAGHRRRRNLVLLVVFWELTSIFSFLLIGYWHHNQNARDGARMAMTITGTGGLALFVGRADHRPYRRQLRPRSRTGIRRPDPRP